MKQLDKTMQKVQIINTSYNSPINRQNLTPSKRTVPSYQGGMSDTFEPSTKFWGVWLPVPTVLAILNSLFWTWLILNTVGYTVEPIEKASQKILEQF